MYDVIVVGGGPAGLTAALYTSRRTLKTLILAKDLGGQMAATTDIENYPGQEKISGIQLAMIMRGQAEKFGAEFKLADVKHISKVDNHFIVETGQDKFETMAVILAFGLTPRNLNVLGEEKFQNKGVTYCANCDAPLYKNKIVAVVGGGNSALDAADYLSRIATKVYLIHRRDVFRGEEIIIKEVLNNPKIEILYNSEIKEIKGERLVNAISVLNNKDNQMHDYPVQGVFIEVGRMAHTDWLTGFVALNERKEIMVNNSGETDQPGVFACGDITNIGQKQVAIATGAGAQAALTCYTYLLKLKGEKIIPTIDWGAKQ